MREWVERKLFEAVCDERDALFETAGMALSRVSEVADQRDRAIELLRRYVTCDREPAIDEDADAFLSEFDK